MRGEGVGVESSGGGFGASVGRLHHRLTDGPPTRGRRILVWGLVALAMLLVVVCSLTIWVQRQALNTDNWVDLSTELLADDEVRGAVALRLVDSLYDQNDVQQELATRLPPPLDRLAAPSRSSGRTPTGSSSRPAARWCWTSTRSSSASTSSSA